MIKISELGLIEYLDAWNMQKLIQQKVINNQSENTLLLLEHPSVYTAGRRTQDSDRPTDSTPVIDVDRGGKITWHGVGQMVGYPILRLKNSTDVVGFVRELETALIKVCSEFGIKADRYCERSGVWIRDEKGDRKIAAITTIIRPDVPTICYIVGRLIRSARIVSAFINGYICAITRIVIPHDPSNRRIICSSVCYICPYLIF